MNMSMNMNKSLATNFVPAPTVRKANARVALVGLSESSQLLLSECFRQFNIESVILSSDAAERLKREKFEACVLTLREGADLIMEALRASASNSRCVIFGLRRHRAGSDAIFEVRHQCGIQRAFGAAGGAETGAGYAHAGAA